MAGVSGDEKREAHARVVARLREQAGEVRRLVTGLDDSALSTRTDLEKWSVKELLCHLLRVQQVFEGRLDRLLSEHDPAIANYEPEEDPEFGRLVARPAERSLAEYLEGRQRLIERLAILEPRQWHRPGHHPDYPSYDVHFAMEYMAHHEAHHIYQIFQRRAPFAPAPH
ncbi:MAG: DinB family protein [Thermoanaerobaculia bacterium]